MWSSLTDIKGRCGKKKSYLRPIYIYLHIPSDNISGDQSNGLTSWSLSVDRAAEESYLRPIYAYLHIPSDNISGDQSNGLTSLSTDGVAKESYLRPIYTYLHIASDNISGDQSGQRINVMITVNERSGERKLSKTYLYLPAYPLR